MSRKHKQIGLLFLFILTFLSLSIGSRSFSWLEFLQGNEEMQRLFWQSRLPRTMSILLASSSLSMAGQLMQTMTQNRFAAPSTTGTIEAAKLGLLMTLFLFKNALMWQKMLTSFAFAMIFTGVFIGLIRRLTIKEKWMLPLFGMIYGGIIGSIAEWIAYRFNLVQSLSSWTQGSFSMIQTHQYEWLFLTLVLLVAVWKFADMLTIANLGEDLSVNLGIPYQQLERLAIGLIALTTSATMITVGSLPFLGVIIPNVARKFSGDHLRNNQGMIAILGMCLTLCCDVLGRTLIAPYEISVSLILGVIGSIVFIRLLWRGEMQ